MKKSNPFLGILILLHSILTATGRHHFESTVHPGFKVTSAQIGDYDFPQCLIPLTPQCYTDNASSQVNFKIMDTKEITALEFLGSGGANAKFKVLPPGSSAEAKGIVISGNVIAEQHFLLPFVPKVIYSASSM
ncbi:unnamed protein product [Dibothriocephalus latus]|uniref:Uncharacterized protein n=1 Tax=Dibothriocephalus latus TaxID=60516 RepID=A0A3P7NTS6_DIBLA|nr:unnamed protein product [Dibothriocephalus latus]